MKLQHESIKTTPLTLDVAHALLKSDAYAFALMDESFTILKTSTNFDAFITGDASAVGLPLQEALWEFMGMEDELTAVLNNNRPKCHLQHINREQSDGSVIYLSFEITRHRLNNDQFGLFLLIQDQTELGVTHQQLTQQKNRLYLLRNELDHTNQALTKTLRIKDIFLSMAVHDMRNPLAAIMGYASLLLSHNGIDAIDTRDKLLQAIVEQSNHLNFLISDLITVDSANSGELQLEIEDTAVDNILSQTIESLGQQIQKKKLTVQLLLPRAPIIIPVDPQRFWQVSYNLITNSIKYTPEGGIIEVEAYIEESHFVLNVSDNGLGISQENINNLFNMYYRTSDAIESSIVGTGIGLYIVKTVVEAHQGKVSVESTLGEGSKFTIRLPISGLFT